MTLTRLGDGAAAFQLRRENVDIKTRLNTLTRELSSGKKADLTKALGGDTTILRDIDRSLRLAQSQSSAAKEIAGTLAAKQVGLNAVDGERSLLVERLINVPFEPSADQRRSASLAGEDAFRASVATLNTRFAGQALFAGAASDGAALATPDDMLVALRTAIAGSADATSAIAAIETWFDAPGGGFETFAYTGDTGPQVQRRLDDSTTVSLAARADDAAVREVLKSAAIAALSEDTGTTLSDNDRAAMLRDAAERSLVAAQGMAELRGRLGQAEGRVETVVARLTAQITSLGILRNEMDSADPFATAGALQEVQVQLETHYSITARLARLSLAEYIR